MRLPALFINHGGGPMPLMGKQPELVRHMKEAVKQYLPRGEEKPKAIVVLSAHWESDPIQITNYTTTPQPPPLLFDYSGFPAETYNYSYPAPGSPELSQKIQKLLQATGIECQLEHQRGFDHGVFVPLLVMFPNADIPVVSVSLHASLNADRNMQIGQALSPLRDDGVLILGSGYTFHNMTAMLHPDSASQQASRAFNAWLKETLTKTSPAEEERIMKELLQNWEQAPGARMCHPRAEHLLPLFMVAAAANFAPGHLIYDEQEELTGHQVTGYVFY